MALVVSTTKKIGSGMMDTSRGANVGILSNVDVMGKFRDNNLCPVDDGNGQVTDNQPDDFHCRHCQSTFSTLVSLQQHMVCDHTNELKSELSLYQHKKHRILDDSGRGPIMHHKKRKLLEAALVNDEIQRNGHLPDAKDNYTHREDHMSHNKPSNDKDSINNLVNGKHEHNALDLSNNLTSFKAESNTEFLHAHQFGSLHSNMKQINSKLSEEPGDFDDEDRLIIDTNGLDQNEREANALTHQSAEYTSYPHKKLKRKDYFDFKACDDSNGTKLNPKTRHPELRKESGQYFSRKQVDSDNPQDASFQRQTVEPQVNVSLPYSVERDLRNETVGERNVEIPVSNDLMKPNFSQPSILPGFPSINMNMYGHFAMPLNFPHPMMYMNPAMFMSPLTNGHPSTDKLLSQVTSQINIPLPQSMSPHTGQSVDQSEDDKSVRYATGHKRARMTERPNTNSDNVKNAVLEIYECKVCSRKFSQVGNFHNHMKLHNEKVCMCGICKLEFSDSYELQRHMRNTHTGSMPYKCNECDREFSQYNNLRRHLRVHNGKTYKCHICGRTFNEVFYLEMHIGSHTGERTYKCGVCSLAFRDNADLQKHVKTHSADELHTCDVCGKSFSKACVLRQHKKMHLGIRPYKCEICSKAFIHRHHLTIHMRMHNTSKPYKCKICHKDFSQTSHLYKHIKQHSEELAGSDEVTGKNGSYPSAAEIEEMFNRIRSPSTTSCKSLESNVSSLSDSSQSGEKKENSGIEHVEDPDTELIKSDSSEVLQQQNERQSSDFEESVSKKCTQQDGAQYSPISTASSHLDEQSLGVSLTQVEIESRHDNKSAEDTDTKCENVEEETRDVSNENDSNDLDLGQKNGELYHFSQRINKSQSEAPDLYRGTNTLSQYGTESSNVLSNLSQFDTSTQCLSHSDSGSSKDSNKSRHPKDNTQINTKDIGCSENVEAYEMSSIEGRRLTDTDSAVRDSSSITSKTESSTASSSSPCPSLGSVSDMSQAESATIATSSPNPSSGSVSDGEKVSKKRQMGKRKGQVNGAVRRRKKKNYAQQNEVVSTQANSQMPLLQGQMPFLPQVMPNISSEMQNLYMLQMQQLQGLHMALFSNAMATQNVNLKDSYRQASVISDVTLKGHEMPSNIHHGNTNVQMKNSTTNDLDPLSGIVKRHHIKKEIPEISLGPVDLSIPKGGDSSAN